MTSEKKHKKDLTLITTHVNADFDALASLLAAQKLYPDSLIVFPGSQEKTLRNFFLNSMAYMLNMEDIKHIDIPSVNRLVLVDTKQANRIGALSSLLHKDGIDIHIYDHHPTSKNDIKGDVEVIRATGATTTILTGIIKEKGIDISPDEATIMCLGIYEDTGSFTFSSTTEHDHLAAAYLLSKGANLNVVSDVLSREISPEQIGILNDMIQASTHYNINGVEVIISTVSSENYISDFALVVHKMVKMENIDAIFALARMGNKIYIVARSRIPEVDVAAILSPLGGGGHAYAAAASIKDKTLVQVENQLLDNLYKKIKPKKLASDLMSSPPIMVESEVSCQEAESLLTRYSINALLVIKHKDGEQLAAGFISRQVIEKVIFHSLGQAPVKEYMTSEMASVKTTANLPEIQEKIIENKQRILPVVENGVIKGVITRTDLLNVLVRQSQTTMGDFHDPYRETIHARTRNVLKFMIERLPERLIKILEKIGEVATETGMDAYVVGGFVRDLFLYRKNLDLDIVVEGDGITFAKRFAKLHGARVNAYEKFSTAVIIFQDGFKIDIASARMEYYKFPAALPTVEMSSIKFDLFRRDFTVNTLAIQLNPGKFGTLIDFFSAQRDIKDKVIRVLHNLSFVEDPTRVFRAIRFEQRFDFSIGKLTSKLIENAVKMDFFQRLSGRRVFNELKLLLEEDNPVPALLRLNDYNLLKFIHHSIDLDKELISLLNSVKKVLSWFDLLFLEESYKKWAVYFLVLIQHCDIETTKEIFKNLEFSPRHKSLFSKERFAAENCLNLLEREVPLQNSELYHKISGFKTELVLSMMATTKNEMVKRSISNYFTHLRYITPVIQGRDLIKLGFSPGPIFRDILEAVHDEKLDGKVKTKADELDFARSFRKTNPAPRPGV